MPTQAALWLALALAGVALLIVAARLLRAIGAHVAMGRRLGGAAQWRIADLIDAPRLPLRPVRVSGRIRCSDPLSLPSGDRLVAYHRDVQVRFGKRRWRTIERIRETRSFELWDHAGSLAVDPAAAAEPLVTIPHVWNGNPQELDETHRRAVERLAEQEGIPTAARAITRTIPVVERLLVLAEAVRENGRVRLVPPPGGYVISTVELDDAMRLLAGPNRRGLALGVGIAGAGVAAMVVGVIGLVANALAG